MEINRSNYSQEGNEFPLISQTLGFIDAFSKDNQDLGILMRKYVFETRTNYLDEELEEEGAHRVSIILAGIGLNLIKEDTDAYARNSKQLPKDRFRRYIILEERTENQEINEMLDVVKDMVLLSSETMGDKIAALEEIWEARHSGQVFAPDY